MPSRLRGTRAGAGTEPQAGRAVTRMPVPRSRLLPWTFLSVMAVQSGLGIAWPGQYRDVEWIRATWWGNDWVTLAVVCPLLAFALTGRRPASPRWQLLVLGLLGYGIYNYAFYMLGAALNALFVLYVLAFVVAVAGLVVALASVPVQRLPACVAPMTPVRLLGGYLAFVAVGLSAVWIVMWALHVFAGRPTPGSPEVFRLVAALDLGFMVPALGTGGVLLWQRHAWGFVIAAIAAVQAALYLFVLSVNSAIAVARGLAPCPGELPIWAPLGATTAVAAVFLLASVDSVPGAGDRGPGDAP